MRNGIIIPCNNQEGKLNIYEYEKFLDNNPDDVLCFVSDVCDGDTHVRLLNFKYIQKERVLVVGCEKNAGKNAAIKAGKQALMAETDVQTIGYLGARVPTTVLNPIALPSAVYARRGRA